MATSDEATRAGLVAQSALMMLGLTRSFGISFTARAPSGFVFDSGLAMFARPGETVLRDHLGLHVYEDTNVVKFLTVNPVGVRVSSPTADLMNDWLNHLTTATVCDTRTAVAFDLFSSSQSESSSRARFLLLMMGIEALLEPMRRPTAETELIQNFVKEVDQAPLAVDAKDRLRSGLTRLLDESIGKAGSTLMQTVGGPAGAAAFREAYQLRNRIVHGGAVVDIEPMIAAAGRLGPLLRDAILVRLRRAAG